jgi:hypothetical protein
MWSETHINQEPIFIAVVGKSMQKRWKEYEGAYVALEEIGDVGEADM